MNKGFSIYLDLVRFLAACLVYIYHSNQRLLVEEILPASNFGHRLRDRILRAVGIRDRLCDGYERV